MLRTKATHMDTGELSVFEAVMRLKNL